MALLQPPRLVQFIEHHTAFGLIGYVLDYFDVDYKFSYELSSRPIEKIYSIERAIGTIGSSMAYEGVAQVPEEMIKEHNEREGSYFGFVYGRQNGFGPFPILAYCGEQFEARVAQLLRDKVNACTTVRRNRKPTEYRPLNMFTFDTNPLPFQFNSNRPTDNSWYFSRAGRTMKEAKLTHPFDIAVSDFLIEHGTNFEYDAKNPTEEQAHNHRIMTDIIKARCL